MVKRILPFICLTPLRFLVRGLACHAHWPVPTTAGPHHFCMNRFRSRSVICVTYAGGSSAAQICGVLFRYLPLETSLSSFIVFILFQYPYLHFMRRFVGSLILSAGGVRLHRFSLTTNRFVTTAGALTRDASNMCGSAAGEQLDTLAAQSFRTKEGGMW
jgi:hypothetical protein